MANNQVHSLFPCVKQTKKTDINPVPPSLFPCVKQVNIPTFPSATNTESAPVGTASSWLQNSSFPEHLVSSLNKTNEPTREPRRQIVSDSSSKRREAYSPHQKKKKNKKKHKKHKDSKVQDKVERYDIFEITYKGDRDNYRYEAIDRYTYDIPQYKNFILSVLGSDTLKIETKSNRQAMSKKPYKPDSGSGDYRYYKNVKRTELVLQHTNKFLRLDSDYISLTVSSQCWATPAPQVPDPIQSGDVLSVGAWLHFISSTGTTKVGLERRYDICEKAIKHLPNNTQLLKEKIKTARLFMSNTQLGRVWTDILFYNPNKLELWLEYLRYKETDLSELNYNSVLAAYRKCFATLLGFQKQTFRSHTFEGDVDLALIRIACKLIEFLFKFGYIEQAVSYHIALLEINTSPTDRIKEDYLVQWKKDTVLLGEGDYTDWWRAQTRTLQILEPDTQVLEGEDVWLAWVREENKKEELCYGPLSEAPTEDTIDRECCVSSRWLSDILFVSPNKISIFEQTFRSYLPSHIRSLPLMSLLDCLQLQIPNKYLKMLCNMCRDVYHRFKPAEQTSIGVVWTIAARALNPSKTDKFVKTLLKEANHRNNMVYWTMYTYFCSSAQTADNILSKMVSSPLSSYHTLVITNKLTTVTCDGTEVEILRKLKSWDEEIDVLLNKPLGGSPDALYLGSTVINTFCRCYSVRIHTNNLPNNYLVQFLSKYLKDSGSSEQIDDLSEQQTVDLYILFNHLLKVEQRQSSPDSSRIRLIGLLAVEQFPTSETFWNVLAKSTTFTPKLWDRLLKIDTDMIWHRRILSECTKQDTNPDINLRNKILSLCVAAIERFPNSILLWELYIRNTQKYSPASIKSVLVRAIKENPSQKSLYLCGAQYCPDERESLYQLMEEKQVRLRVLIEEVQMFSAAL